MKKVKLFTTIASLCLAVALMAFGVYAATSVNVTVSGQVSFLATANVKATIKSKKLYTNIQGQTSETEFQTGDGRSVSFTGAETQPGTGNFDGGTIDLDSEGMKAAAASANGATATYGYVIEITNDAHAQDAYKTLVVKVTYPTDTNTTVADDNYKITVVEITADGTNVTEGEDGAMKIAIGKSATYSVTIEVNANANVSDKDIGSSIVLTMAA